MIALTLVIAGVFFVFDLELPSGVGEWGFYLFPLLLTVRVRTSWYPFAFTALCSVLLAVGFVCSPALLPWRLVAVDRLVGIGALWITVRLLVQRKRAEQALQLSEGRLRAILDHSPLAIFAKDLRGRYIEFNRECEITNKQTRDKVLGKTDTELFPKPVSDIYTITDQKALEAGRAVTEELQIPRPDGERTLLSIKFPLRDADGRCMAVCGVSADITELKHAERELRHSRERLALLARVTAAVVGARPLAEEGRKLAEHVRSAFGVDFCIIRTLEGNDLTLLASSGVPEDQLQLRLPVELGLANEMFAGRKAMFMADVRTNAAAAACMKLLPQEHQYISYAGAPLLAQDKVVGILGIYSLTELAPLADTDLEHLQIVANHIAVAIVNDRLYREVERQKNQMAEEVSVRKRVEEALQTLSHRLLELQETERRHLARELHDEIGQGLTALKINLQAVQRLGEAAQFAPRLLDSIGIVDRILKQVRDLSLDLRPSMLDDLGLCAALRWYADQQGQRAGLRIQFACADLDTRLEPAVETACFRVAQEALTNVVRHARASKVLVRLETDGPSLHLAVCDDGAGFDPEKLRRHPDPDSRLGLLGMEERASLIGGRIEFRSAPRQGTEVHAWFPLAVDSMEEPHASGSESHL
ncbi:MAG TPA: PAS domain-containing protein [Verrucomicrobiae bacterium]|nr:PAS domain-containing protein [Verrucomicrobiae bacterium]